MAEKFFVADLHLGHKNIVLGVSEWKDKSGCRDFDTLEEHDDFIINNINDTVGVGDKLYILGDFVFGGKGNIPHFRKRIKCKDIVLVRGNHDIHMYKNSIVHDGKKYINVNSLFREVHDLIDMKLGKSSIVMCHYPLLTWHKKDSGALHLYGHCHMELGYNPQAICVSLECNPQMKPFSLSKIKQIYNNRIK